MLKTKNGKCYFTLDELHDLACHIARNIISSHPDIGSAQEVKNLAEEVALDTVNQAINLDYSRKED